MQTTVQGKLFPTEDQVKKTDKLMRIQSSCMRYSYNRICEGEPKSEIEADLKEKFPGLNSRYRRDAFFRAEANYKSAKELVKMGELESPEKVVFGGRSNLKRREHGEITKKEWKKLRNNQLYSRGEKRKKGNLNLRLLEDSGELFLRVNIGSWEWINIPAYLPSHIDKFLDGNKPYGVRILRKDGDYELRVNFEEENVEPPTGFEKGAIGVDFNHDTIDLTVTNEQGQLKDTKTIKCHALTTAEKEKRGWLIGNYVKEAVDYAKYWNRGLVIEKLDDVARGQQNQHEFVHKKFLEAVKCRAEREGVEIREINPAYTSVIGKQKYASHYHITIHQAAALVVARRGQGFSEYLRGLKTLLLKAMEAGEEGESVPTRRVHSWILWRLTRNLPSRKGTSRRNSDQSSETTEVESRRTIDSTERSSDIDEMSERKTVTPGSGPS